MGKILIGIMSVLVTVVVVFQLVGCRDAECDSPKKDEHAYISLENGELIVSYNTPDGWFYRTIITGKDLYKMSEKAYDMSFVGCVYVPCVDSTAWEWIKFTKEDIVDQVDGFTKIQMKRYTQCPYPEGWWVPNEAIFYYPQADDYKKDREKIESQKDKLKLLYGKV